MTRDRILLVIAFTIVCIVWGSTWLAIKIGLRSVPPFYAAGIRFSIASAVLFGIARVRGLSIPRERGAVRIYLTLGVLTFSIPFALAYWGQQFIPSGLSSILFAVYPFWVAIFSHLMLKGEPINGYKLAGIGFGFFGLVVVFSADVHWQDSAALYGMLAIAASTIIQAFALVVLKKHAQPMHPIVMNAVGMFLGAALLLLMALVSESFAAIRWDSAAVGSMLYLALVGSVMTFVSYHWLLKRIEAVFLALTSFINPIVAVLLGGLILGEALAPSVFTGAGLVLAGILIANGKSLYAKIHPSA